MNQFTVLFILTLVWNLAPAQTTLPDTVFVKRTVDKDQFEIDTLFIQGGQMYDQVLVGTTFLSSSNKMIGLLNNGLEPISLEIIDYCDNTTHPSTFEKFPKFIQVNRDSTVLTIEVAVIANCCHNFLGEAEVIGNDTLNLVYTSYGGFCSCSCAFTLRYKFDTTMEADYQILKFVTINGSSNVGVISNED